MKKDKIDSYNDFVYWDGHIPDNISYIKTKKMKDKETIKNGNCSIYKLGDSYLLKTTRITQWVGSEDLKNLKKILNKMD